MGGHGGLNILPQKRWNVYNRDNRERVRRDEEEAARQQEEEKQRQRERDADVRLNTLRTKARTPALAEEDGVVEVQQQPPETEKQGDDADVDAVATTTLSTHDQLFHLFQDEVVDVGSSKRRRMLEAKQPNHKDAKRQKKKEERQAASAAEDERYRLGYGTTPNSQPWYMSIDRHDLVAEGTTEYTGKQHKDKQKQKNKKKSVEELRAERIKREEGERAKARRLLHNSSKSKSNSYYNSSFGNARTYM